MKYAMMVFSPTGGTKKAAEAVSSQWHGETEYIDLTASNVDFSKYTFAEEDVVLLAAPSFGGRVPSLALDRVRQIKGNGSKCILMAVYGNRAYEDTLVEMEDVALECGFTVVAAIAAVAEHSIMHQFAAGRPDAADIKALNAFSNQILEKIKGGSNAPVKTVPGNRPYKKAGALGLLPKANKDCIECGICAAQCPANAIDPANIKTADAKKCVSCMRCGTVCPRSARKANELMIAAASLAIKKACSIRKECELYI